MDTSAFIHGLGYKRPEDMVNNFSENLVVFMLLQSFDNILNHVHVRKRKNIVQFVVEKKIEPELSKHRVTMHNQEFQIKTRKEKKDTIIEAHPYK